MTLLPRQTSSDPNAGSLVLFKRYGCPPETQSWALGRVVNTFFVDEALRVVEPTADNAHRLDPWLTISPDKPEGLMAPTTLSVPLDFEHVDPVVHGTDIPQ